MAGSVVVTAAVEPPGETSLGRIRLFARIVSSSVRRSIDERGASVRRTLLEALNASVGWAKWEVDGLSPSVPYHASRESLLRAALFHQKGEGLHLEFGVYEGASINLLADLDPGPGYGFDSFVGLPSDWTPFVQRGDFSTGGVLPETRKNVTLVQGWFAETLPRFLESRPGFRVSFLHVDCDLYPSTSLVLGALSGGIQAGTVIVFDEYAGLWPDDEARAFREWRNRTQRRFEFLGCSATGGVAVRIR